MKNEDKIPTLSIYISQSCQKVFWRLHLICNVYRHLPSSTSYMFQNVLSTLQYRIALFVYSEKQPNLFNSMIVVIVCWLAVYFIHCKVLFLPRVDPLFPCNIFPSPSCVCVIHDFYLNITCVSKRKHRTENFCFLLFCVDFECIKSSPNRVFYTQRNKMAAILFKFKIFADVYVPFCLSTKFQINEWKSSRTWAYTRTKRKQKVEKSKRVCVHSYWILKIPSRQSNTKKVKILLFSLFSDSVYDTHFHNYIHWNLPNCILYAYMPGLTRWYGDVI